MNTDKSLRWKSQNEYYQRNKQKVKERTDLCRKNKKKLGLCVYCNLPSVTKIFCDKHRKMHSMGMIRVNYGISNEEYKLLGNKCMICGLKRTDENTTVSYTHLTLPTICSV